LWTTCWKIITDNVEHEEVADTEKRRNADIERRGTVAAPEGSGSSFDKIEQPVVGSGILDAGNSPTHEWQ
jgi:hypothetical protein